MYVAAARACVNAVVAASAGAALGVGTGASGFERLTISLSDSGAGAPSPSGALRLPSDAAGGGLSCSGMLDECALVPRGIGGKGELSEGRPSTSRRCACASSHSASYLVRCPPTKRPQTYLLAPLPPRISRAPHLPRRHHQSMLDPDL